MMEVSPLPPYLSYTDERLDESIDGLYKELRKLYPDERQYKLDLHVTLEGLMGSRKMAIWSKGVEDEVFKPRKVTITFHEGQNLFHVVSGDGEPVLKGYPVEELRRRGWFSASDGHAETNAIVSAPREAQVGLEALFANPREYASRKSESRTASRVVG